MYLWGLPGVHPPAWTRQIADGLRQSWPNARSNMYWIASSASPQLRGRGEGGVLQDPMCSTCGIAFPSQPKGTSSQRLHHPHVFAGGISGTFRLWLQGRGGRGVQGGRKFRPGTISQGIISPPLKSPKPQASMCLAKCLSIFEK